MCGITGILSLNNKPINPLKIKNMCDIVSHRGPDDAGYGIFSISPNINKKNYCLDLTDNEFKHKNINLTPIESDYAKNKINQNQWHLALGHRRLSIIDLSSNAHQPMSDRNKKIWLIHNGEIYNFKEIKKELLQLGYKFHSTSDTEVIIYSYKEWGIKCIDKFNGMFAFALWDNEKNKFFLARDRFGIIPVYYYNDNATFIFGSEIKSILESNLIKTEIDPKSLNEYFTFQNIFTDRTLFNNIKILPSGSYIEISIKPNKSRVEMKKYWDYNFSFDNFKLSESQTEDRLYDLFRQAVTSQLVSDVPVGSYLSGGMDSGSIVAIAGKHFGRICTFCLGFDLSSASGLELGFDERKYAEILSNLYKTEHYEAVLHAGDMEAVLPNLIWHLEDLRVGQCYPNYYIARLAGKFVKVVLSGGGGDELFGGYPWRYFVAIKPKNKHEFHKKYYDYWQRLVQDEEKEKFFSKEILKDTKNYSTFDVFRNVFKKNNNPKSTEDFINESMYFEIKTFLHGLFVIENKISMAHSLETRVPFLDNDMVDFAQSIPPHYKLKTLTQIKKKDEDDIKKLTKYFNRTNGGKEILRKAMQKIIPNEITERVKQGFSAPDASWFKGESIDYIKSLLLNKKAHLFNYLNYDFVNNKITEHASGKTNHRLFIWSLLSFEWWLRKFIVK